jgi:PAS domain S-box-containing protein
MTRDAAELDALRARVDAAALERRIAHAQVTRLLDVSAAMLASDDLDEQLRLLAGAIVDACSYRRCVITLVDQDWRIWKRAHAGLSAEEARSLEETPALPPETRRKVLDEAYRIGNSYFIPHESRLGSELAGIGVATSRRREEFVDWHPEDLLFVPLLGKDGRVLGTISVDDPVDGRRPTPDSLRILELFAREAAFAIELSTLLHELARTEGYLRNLVRSSRDAIITTDPSGRVVVFNEGAQRMLGWPASEIVGQSVLRLYGSEEEARGIMRRLMSPAQGGPGQLEGHETVLVAKDGEPIPVAISASALYDAQGRFLGTAGISRDLRPWKRLERELVASEKAATVGEVAATLCHEINNFLEEILSAGQVSLLTLDRGDVRDMYGRAGMERTLDKEVERLTVISKEALKIAGLTSRLQSIARGGAYTTTEYVGEIRMVEVPGGELAGRILVADDREYIREFLKDFLVLEGFEVDVARDGNEAVAMVRERRYDLVLSDIKMPGKNGYEVFESVRSSDPATKVILMTAYGYDPSHSIVKASEAGLSDVLYKPFQMARVREAIVRALARDGDGARPGGTGSAGDAAPGSA